MANAKNETAAPVVKTSYTFTAELMVVDVRPEGPKNRAEKTALKASGVAVPEGGYRSFTGMRKAKRSLTFVGTMADCLAKLGTVLAKIEDQDSLISITLSRPVAAEVAADSTEGFGV